jgi:hypothetical protein
MLAPQDYEKARHQALFHLQVELQSLPSNVKMPCEDLRVKGQVVRIFRGHYHFQIRDTVKFALAVLGDRDAPPLSGILWLRDSNLRQMQYIEVFLNGKPPIYDVALYQYELIEAPTDEPVISFPLNFGINDPPLPPLIRGVGGIEFVAGIFLIDIITPNFNSLF